MRKHLPEDAHLVSRDLNANQCLTDPKACTGIWGGEASTGINSFLSAAIFQAWNRFPSLSGSA